MSTHSPLDSDSRFSTLHHHSFLLLHNQFTEKSKWLGGFYRDGKAVSSFETLKEILSTDFELVLENDMPFFIRETARKNQWSVTKGSFWIRK
jgi:hypothetical protein